MSVVEFDPAGELIIVEAYLWSSDRRARTRMTLALDTGSAETVIVPHQLERLGYSTADAERITGVRSAVGKENGCLLRVSRFSAFGYSALNFSIHAFALPDGFGIDGLLGLSFLRQFNYEVRSQEGRILVDRCAA